MVVLVLVDLDEHDDPGYEDGQRQQAGNDLAGEAGAEAEDWGDEPFDQEPGDEDVESLEGVEVEALVALELRAGEDGDAGDPADPGDVAEQGGVVVADVGPEVAGVLGRDGSLGAAADRTEFVGVTDLFSALYAKCHCFDRANCAL